MKDVRSWFVGIAATHRASAGWALAAMSSSWPRSPPAPPSRCWRAVPAAATLVRLMAVESGRSVLRAAKPGRPGTEATRANETMIRSVVVFVGRAV